MRARFSFGVLALFAGLLLGGLALAQTVTTGGQPNTVVGGGSAHGKCLNVHAVYFTNTGAVNVYRAFEDGTVELSIQAAGNPNGTAWKTVGP